MYTCVWGYVLGVHENRLVRCMGANMMFREICDPPPAPSPPIVHTRMHTINIHLHTHLLAVTPWAMCGSPYATTTGRNPCRQVVGRYILRV